MSVLTQETSFLLPGPVGDLEVVARPPKEGEPKGLVIICHPHPLHKGTMNNKVVSTAAKAFETKGFISIRFNFRGVGASQGVFDEGKGEKEDALAVLHWARQRFPGYKIWMAGFSFGAYIAACIAQENPIIQQLLMIAPAVNKMDYNNYQAIKSMTCPWVVIQGDNDDIVSAEAVTDWYNNVPPNPNLRFPSQLIIMSGASHFFHGKLIDLQQIVEQNIYDPSA